MTPNERLSLQANETPLINFTTILKQNAESVSSMDSLDKESFNAGSTRFSLAFSPVIKTFLRIKYNESNNNSETNSEECLYEVQNNFILTRFPSDINPKTSRIFKTHESVCKKFTYNKVFKAETSQATLFEETVQDQVMDFLMGQSSTIMSFGTTNSGKTFTMFGTPSSPGIIPRSIEYVFSIINCTLSPWYKMNGGNIMSLDETDRIKETLEKSKLLNSKLMNESHYINARKSLRNSEQDTSIKERDECSGEAMYCVWLSFVEIYNENIYDLLTVAEEEKCPLTLTSGKNGLTYIKGLKHIYVTTAFEACQVLMAGQSKMSIAATSLNSKSSRSHTIFTIRLLKYLKENMPEEVEVSTLTFCDLAGSGGTRNIEDDSLRLQEACSINNSILVLGRCLKTMHQSQSLKQSGDHVTGLFRESKLTRMFQKALSGQESLTLIVHFDPNSKLLVESQNALNTCAITKRIIEPKKNTIKIYNSTFTVTPKSSSDFEFFTSSSFERTSEKMDSTIFDDFKSLNKPSDIIIQNDNIENDLKRDYSVREELINCLYNALANFKKIWQEEHIEYIHIPWLLEVNAECSKTLEKLIKIDNSYNEIESGKDINNIKLCKSLRKNHKESMSHIKALTKLISERERSLKQEILADYSIMFDDMTSYIRKQIEMFDISYPTSTSTEVEVNLLDPNDYQSLKEENMMLQQKIEDLNNALVNRECEVRQELVDQYLLLIENVEQAWKKRTKEVECEGQDLLKWSVQQIEAFYKERINNIMKSRKHINNIIKFRKRRKMVNIDEEDEESSKYENLLAENSQITSKIVVLKQDLKRLREINQKITVEQNTYKFELSLVKEDFKNLEDSLKAILVKCKIQDVNKCDSVQLLQKLEKLIDTQSESIETSKKELKKKELLLAENLKEINDLKQELSENSKYMDTLNYQVELQEQKFVDVQQVSGENEILEYSDEDSEKTTTDSEYKINDKTSIIYCQSPDNSLNDSCETYFEQKDSDLLKKSSNNSLSSTDLFIEDVIDPIMPTTEVHIDITQNEKHLERDLKYETQKDSLNVSYDGRPSFLESSESINHSIFRSSDESSKNDSGIVTKDSDKVHSLTCDIIDEDDEKAIQFFETNEDNLIEFDMKQQLLDKTFFFPEFPKKSNFVERLLNKITNLQHTIRKLNENEEGNKRSILEYEYKIKMRDEEIKHLTEIKNQIMFENKEMSITLEKNRREYGKEINELNRRLAIREETETSAVKCLDQLLDRFTNLENQLSVTQTHLETTISKCSTQHANKIEELEKEILEKTMQINDMSGKISEANCDLAKIEDLTDKVNEFETIWNMRRREDDYLRRQLYENSEMQLNLNYKLKKFITKGESNESALMFLRTEIKKIVHANTINNNKARQFGARIGEVYQTINKIRDDILQMREMRKNVEMSCKQQIMNIKSDFSTFLRTTVFPNLMCVYKQEKQEEINQLQSELHEKERQIIAFKEDKDIMIEKYASLIKYISLIRLSDKTRNTDFYKTSEFCAVCAEKSVNLIHDQTKQKKLSRNQHDNSRTPNFRVFKESGSQTKEIYDYSQMSDSNIFSDDSITEDTEFNQVRDTGQLQKPVNKSQIEDEVFTTSITDTPGTNSGSFLKKGDRSKWAKVNKCNVEAKFLFPTDEKHTDIGSSEDESNLSNSYSTFQIK